MGSLANSSSLQTTIQENPLLLSLSAFSQLSLLTLKPSPRLRLMPTTAATVMALPTTGTAMAWLTVVTTVLMLTPMELTDTTTARGLLRLRLSPPPLLSSADAYYGRYGYGLAHHAYGYGLAHHGAYYGAYAHPYAYGHYYGKRSAEAGPEADAYYGHHYGYGLAHHGYGYAHHGYYGYPYAARGYYGYHH